MPAALLHGSGHRQHFSSRPPLSGQGIGQCRQAFGQRAGLVDCQHANALGQLQRFGVLYQHAGARALAGAHHDGGRRGQAECARAGDDQHRHRVDQCLLEIAHRKPPAGEGEQRNHHHDRHEHRRDTVGETLHRRLRALRLLDQANDAGEQGLRPDPGGAATQVSVAVEGGGKDAVTAALVDGQTLAGEHSLIDRRLALLDHTIDRHRVARPQHEEVSGLERLHCHLDELAITLDQRHLRLQAKQGVQCRRGAGLGARLHQLAEQHERDDHRRGFEVHMQVVASAEGHDHAVEVGHRGAERDQHVHVGAATAQRGPCATIKARTNPELHRGCEQQLPPARHQVVHHLAPRPPAEHGRHLRRQRQAEQGRDPEMA